MNIQLKVGINLLQDEIYKDQLDNFNFGADYNFNSDNEDLHILVLNNNDIIFVKIYQPREIYFSETDIDGFLNSDKELILKNFKLIETIQFKKNILSFNHYDVHNDIDDSIQNIVFKLNDEQLVLFKTEFNNLKNLKLFNNL